MKYIDYRQSELYVEDVRLTDIAVQFDTPSYVYSRACIENNWHSFDSAFQDIPHKICYAVKANSNIGILNVLARLGSGFDIVSMGELERVLAANGDPKKIVFSGVGKRDDELKRALAVGIYCFNIESDIEIERLNSLAKQHKQVANVALRVNPNIDSGTHPYISTGLKENKFGIDIESAHSLCQTIKQFSNLQLIGIACHIGSQLTSLEPFLAAIDKVVDLINLLKNENIQLEHINIGGGLGIRYSTESPPSIINYVNALCDSLRSLSLQVIIEPGRAIVANAGVLLTKVEYVKHTPHKKFAIVDAGMNDLLRPALYNAWQDIIPVILDNNLDKCMYDIVGPVCESADFIGKNRFLCLKQNDLLAVCSSGAYGFSMSSTYNSRPRVAEILVDKNQSHLIRPRETITDLFISERMLP